MEKERAKQLLKKLEELGKVTNKGVIAEVLSPETKAIMKEVEQALKNLDYKYVADNGFGPGTRPPKIPGYDRIPDFAVDRNNDGYWDMIIEVKSSSDWDKSDDQLIDFFNFCKKLGIHFIIVVPPSIKDQAKARYKKLGFFDYVNFQLL